MNKYFWRKGKQVTEREFLDLLRNHQSFFDTFLKSQYPVFFDLSKKAQIEIIISQRYKKNKWFWAWCFTAKSITMHNWDSAFKHIYDSVENKLYTDVSFPKRYKISTGSDGDIIAFGETKKSFEIISRK